MKVYIFNLSEFSYYEFNFIFINNIIIIIFDFEDLFARDETLFL